MRRSVVGIAAVVFAWTCGPLAAWGADNLVPGRYAIVNQGADVKFRAVPLGNGTFDLPDGDPREVGATIEVFDTAGGAGSQTFVIPAGGGWSKLPLGRPNKIQGYMYHGSGDPSDPCTWIAIMPRSLRAHCGGSAITIDPPFTGEVGVILTVGTTRYCASFGGDTKKNDERRLHRRNAPPPAACPTGGGGTTTTTVGGGTTSTIVSETTTTTIGGETTTTTIVGETTTTTVVGETTTTTVVGETTTTTVAGETTTTTVVGETTTTSIPGETTTTTITGETTTTTIGGGGCCNGAGFLNFTSVDAPGDCGDIIDAGGAVVNNINCAGLYTGGGGNSVPLPYDLPDRSSAVSAIASCEANVATIGPATSAQTGTNKNCSDVGCFFGAPLPVPNPGSTPTSVCVINKLSEGVSGTVDCATGASDIDAPLSSVLFLTGDTSTDPSDTIPGIQPCPLCSNDLCIGGTNNGMACEPGTSALNPAFPTSNDCPPDPMFNIGTLPVAFSLTSGTVTWRGTNATNDTGGTQGVQGRVFSGFCRDTDGTGGFQGTTPATAVLCWENGMAVGAPCSGTFETCEQRNNGAFGPAGGSNRTIIAIGASNGLLGGPAAGTLVSIFTIRPTFDATVDAAGDLPGPGAVALPGTATLCATANPCP